MKTAHRDRECRDGQGRGNKGRAGQAD